MKEFDTFFQVELADYPQDEVLEVVLRDLSPSRKKYRCMYAEARFSSDPDKYPDRLWPRLGRGQWVGTPWSVEVVQELNKIPEAWR